MNIMHIMNSLPGAAYMKPAMSAAASVEQFTPLSHGVHYAALQVKSDRLAQFIEGAQVPAKPIDKVIQAFAYPIFALIASLKAIKNSESFGEGIAHTFFILPTLAGSCLGSASYVIGAAVMLIPFKAGYAAYNGKEAAREHIDYRHHVQGQYKGQGIDVIDPLPDYQPDQSSNLSGQLSPFYIKGQETQSDAQKRVLMATLKAQFWL